MANAPSAPIPHCVSVMGPRFWLNLQTEYDMRITVRTMHDKVAPRIRTFQPRHD